MIFAGIVAGGCGSRMKCADKPKQFLEIGNVPVLIRTVKAFLGVKKIDKIYVGIKADWHEYADEIFDEFGVVTERVKIIDGGADRNATVMAILDEITSEYECGNGDIILTHDAVRPFVSKKIIEDNIECAKKYKVCGTYIPAIDTIVKSTDANVVESSLTRSELYQAQTPQSFDIGALCVCRDRLSKEKLSILTDTCGIFTECGINIHIVEGDVQNFKITTDYDYKVANLLIKNR